jgi:hypothetical protein
VRPVLLWQRSKTPPKKPLVKPSATAAATPAAPANTSAPEVQRWERAKDHAAPKKASPKDNKK